jgi:hypothetical protein
VNISYCLDCGLHVAARDLPHQRHVVKKTYESVVSACVVEGRMIGRQCRRKGM